MPPIELEIISRAEIEDGDFIRIVTVYRYDGKTRIVAPAGMPGKNGQGGRGGSVSISGGRATVTIWKHKDPADDR